MRYFLTGLIVILVAAGCVFSRGQTYDSFTIPTPLQDDQYLILGFLGGREPWNSEREGVRRLALRLRARKQANIAVETVENTRRRLAIRLIQNAFDRNEDGRLDEIEKSSARLILYGQSFGGAAVIKLAKELESMGIPVLLTVQIDSVGRHDHVVPRSVESAANLFQRNGKIIRGEPVIRAADPQRTKIIGNYEFDYSKKQIDISEVSWWKKLFRKDHTRMNLDPDVWNLVEKLILENLDR